MQATTQDTSKGTLQATTKDTSKKKSDSQILKEMREKKRKQNERYRTKKAAAGQKLIQVWVPEEVAGYLKNGNKVIHLGLASKADSSPLTVKIRDVAGNITQIWPPQPAEPQKEAGEEKQAQ